MRSAFLLTLMALAACGAAQQAKAPAEPEPDQIVLRDLAPPPAAPDVCVEDTRAALDRRLQRDTTWSHDPIAGAMNMRTARYSIAAHSYESLIQGIGRYRTLPTAVLVTYAGESESCVWLVSATGIDAYVRSSLGQAQIAADVASAAHALSLDGMRAARSPVRRTATPQAPAPVEQAAPFEPQRLAVALANVAETVVPDAIAEAASHYQAIIVAPHEALAGFPFTLLPARRVASVGQPYLIDVAAIEIAPALGEVGLGLGLHRINAAADLSTMSAEQRRAALARAVVVGDPAYDDSEYDMPPLPAAAEEARAVAAELGVTPLIGEGATSAALQGEFRRVGGARYVHLATHGIADVTEVESNRTFLALAGGDRLTMFNTFSNDVRDAVVVLSACQTGLGAVRPGGVVGLPRRMQISGAQAVVMSMWNVDDRATGAMMQSFPRHLLESGRTATAFRAAVLETRERYPDPRHWGSFQVFSVAPL